MTAIELFNTIVKQCAEVDYTLSDFDKGCLQEVCEVLIEKMPENPDWTEDFLFTKAVWDWASIVFTLKDTMALWKKIYPHRNLSIRIDDGTYLFRYEHIIQED
jgi:hypothetical protein